MSEDARAPIFTATWDVCAWLLKKAQSHPHDVLARSLADNALRLLDNITLALRNIDRDNALLDADIILVQLRLRVRLAEETALFNALQRQYAVDQLDAIGRQLGGWQKTL
jgi:hypothetical protein